MLSLLRSVYVFFLNIIITYISKYAIVKENNIINVLDIANA